MNLSILLFVNNIHLNMHNISGARIIKQYMCYVVFFFLSFSLLIGWQLSIWNCCKPLFSLSYNCQLLCFWQFALSIVVKVFPQPFFWILLVQGCLLQNLLCLIVCPIREWCLLFKIFKSKLSSFAL